MELFIETNLSMSFEMFINSKEVKLAIMLYSVGVVKMELR